MKTVQREEPEVQRLFAELADEFKAQVTGVEDDGTYIMTVKAVSRNRLEAIRSMRRVARKARYVSQGKGTFPMRAEEGLNFYVTPRKPMYGPCVAPMIAMLLNRSENGDPTIEVSIS